MSRITKEEVIAQAEKLNQNGIKPSVIKIRELLGRGSYSTITKYLEEWAPNETAESEIPETPESVENLTAIIWSTCYKETAAIFEKKITALNSELADVRAELNSAQRATDQLETELEERERRAEAAEKSERATRIAEQAAQARLEAAARELEDIRARIQDAEKRTLKATEEAAELRGRLSATSAGTEKPKNGQPPKPKKDQNKKKTEPQALVPSEASA